MRLWNEVGLGGESMTKSLRLNRKSRIQNRKSCDALLVNPQSEIRIPQSLAQDP
jgi:hypothetical protein